MININFDKLHDLIQKGNHARAYAWEHYEELVARESEHVLYGPMDVFMGAAIPCHLVSPEVRKLTRTTRRKKYLRYELDQNYRVIRVTSIYPNESVYSVHHVFELDGVIYGCAFRGDEKRLADNRIEAISFSEGKPQYYAQTSESSIFCEFYEYPTENSRIDTGYLYFKNCQLTSCRLQPNWDAPFGAPDSPVSVHCYESTPWDLDFSKYFQ